MKLHVKEIIVIVCCILLSACIFPICLVRRSENVDPALHGVEYGLTDEGNSISQTFIAQTSYLEAIVFDIAFGGGKHMDGELRFSVMEDRTGKIVAEQMIPISDVNDGAFSEVPVGIRLKKGWQYTYKIETAEESDVKLQVYYTTMAEHATPGNVTLYLEENPVEGQSVTRYVYSFPLNYKNVICIWMFIWIMGLLVLECMSKKPIFGNCRILERFERLLNRFQIPILFAELLVVIIMLVRISRNEAVHWDEAYTWRMVTKNTVAEMLAATAADVHPPFYYLLLKAAMTLFGKNMLVAKTVSIAGTVATGILGLTLVRKNWGVKAAIPFVMVTALAPQLVYYSLDLRMYSWLCFFVMAAALFAYEIIQSRKLRWWAAFTLVSLGGVYTQYFAVVPLFVIYLYLLIYLLLNDRKEIKKFLLCCSATVIGYLPWLGVVVETLNRDAADGKGEEFVLQWQDILEWAFGSNITFSEYMPALFFLMAIACLLKDRKKYSKKEMSFIVTVGVMFFASLCLCVVLSSKMNHFWNNRYLVDALLFVWLFMIIVLARKNLIIWGLSMCWLGILMLSSYTVMQATELGTIPWIQNTKQLFSQVQEEEKIVYSFPTFDVLYEYYVPNAEFVWYEEVDFATWDQDEFYMLDWGGSDFPWYLYEQGILRKEVIGSMRLEEGIYSELWKITIQR